MNTIEKDEKIYVSVFWKYLALFLLGLFTGFVFAPVKNGVEICSHNENSMNADTFKEETDK